MVDFNYILFYLSFTSFPFGGCNSTIEALCLNKPVITLPGKFINSRFTYGFYLKMGVLDLVSENIEEYINLCLKCVNDIEWLNNIKIKIASNINKILEDKESSLEWDNKLIELFENYIDNLE